MPKAKSSKQNRKTNVGLKASRFKPLSRKLALTKRKKIKTSTLVVAMLLASAIGFLAYKTLAAGPGYDTSAAVYDLAGQAKLRDDPARGMIYGGLRLIKTTANHPCKGIFEISDVKDRDGKPLCTHGPDPAPEGVNISKVRPEQRLQHLDKQSKQWATPAQLQSLVTPPEQIADDPTLGAFTNPYPLSPVPCTSGGHRIQLVLLSNIPPNSYTSLARTLLRQAAYRMETQLQVSATHSGPGSTNRHFRFVTNGACEPTVSTLIAQPTTSLANPSNDIAYLRNHGYNAPSTRYLAWVYATNTPFCASGNILTDNSPNANLTETSSYYSVVGPGCWSSEAEIHETMHTLGAVSNIAPHTTGANHCLDQHDVMCYPDHKDPVTHQYADCKASNGTTFPCGQNGRPIFVAANCSATGYRWQLDCNKNDYFNTGVISSTNYLYNHWNVARSPFLQR